MGMPVGGGGGMGRVDPQDDAPGMCGREGRLVRICDCAGGPGRASCCVCVCVSWCVGPHVGQREMTARCRDVQRMKSSVDTIGPSFSRSEGQRGMMWYMSVVSVVDMSEYSASEPMAGTMEARGGTRTDSPSYDRKPEIDTPHDIPSRRNSNNLSTRGNNNDTRIVR